MSDDEYGQSLHDNARLIAAAPKMLEALRTVLPYLPGDVNDPDSILRAVSDVIAEAME